MEMNGRDWLFAAIWLGLVLTVEAVTQQAISSSSPLDSTTQFVGEGTSFWGITSSASSWYIYFWLKWDDPGRGASLMDFFVGSQAMYLTEERDTGNFYTSAGTVSNLQVSGYWVFVAFYTEDGNTKSMVKRWARSATTQSGLTSLSLSPDTAYIKIPNEFTFTYHVILMQYKLVNMVFSTDSVSSATITSAMNSGECFSSCTNHCSAPILTNAYCNCDGTCSLCYDAGIFQCATCPSGSPRAEGNCVTCHSYCETCSDNTSTGCSTCKSNASLPTGVSPGACTCNLGYYGNPDACATCDSSCKSCNASGSSACTGCKENASLPAGLSPGACTCNDGYFGSASSCQRCSAMCKTCTVAASCTNCFSHASNNSGACVCDSGYYPSPDASNCLSCDASCLACSAGGASGCTNCKSHASAASSPGACVCNSGYYGSSDNCLACDGTCTTCTSGGTSGCIGCKSNAELSSNPGQCICVTGYFPNPTSATCAPCDSTCLQCVGSSANQCTLCKSHAHLDSSPGTCTCDNGYFPNTTSSNCSPCAETCLTCSGQGESKCTSCWPGASLTAFHTCVCKPKFFPNPSASSCRPCHSACPDSCFGPDILDCIDQAALNFRQGAKELGLPYTVPKAGLICYRNPVPTGLGLVRFMQKTGTWTTDSSSWSLTQLQCDRFLSSIWFEHNSGFFQVFKKLQLPEYKRQQAEAIFRLWEMQFGLPLLTSDPDWRLLVYTLTHVQGWNTITGFPQSYFDGSKVQRLPSSLIAWISSGNKDYEVLNYWNDIAAVCFSGSCAASDADICCGRAVSCSSPCCAAFPTKQTTCSSK